MNDIFSFRRFGLLFKKTILERPVQLFGLTALSLALVFFSYLIGKALGDFESGQFASFIVGIVGGGSFLASMVFNYFSSNAMGSSFLTLPASHFEKWLCGVLITGVIYVAVFLLFYRAIDTMFVSIYHNGLDPNGPFYKQLYEQVGILSFYDYVPQKGIHIFFIFAGAMLLGSLYFNRVGFIKVALILCVLWSGLYLINLLIAKSMIPNTENALPFLQAYINAGERKSGVITLPLGLARTVTYIFNYFLPASLWLLTLQRLREKEF